MPNSPSDRLTRILKQLDVLKLIAICAFVIFASAWALPRSWANAADSSQKSFESGLNRVSLLELYTSEGCSSCPPADLWLSRLKEGEALWRSVVPVAFHVSYWDRLGWPDRFAQRQFDTRQRLLAQRDDTGVYTPGLFRDGAEFRSWRTGYRDPAITADRAFIAASQRSSPVGNLTLEQSGRVEPNSWSLLFNPASGSARRAKKAFVAVLGNNLSSEIQRGENAGKRLIHDFVVLALVSKSLDQKGPSTLGAEFTIDTAAYNAQTTQPALAAWVVDENGNPVQAVGGLL